MTQKVNKGVKNFLKNLKGFSLVELIIVIAIVAILSVAGFLTLQKWISQSRDSKRLGDLQTIEKSLTVNYADSDTSELYPMPYKAEETTGDDGETTWYQGYFGSGVVKKLSSLSETPQDPLWTGYEYSVTTDQSAFEVYAELENEKELSYTNRVYADEGGTIAKRGNYEGYLMSTDGSNYNLYNPPSIYIYSGSQLISGDTNYVYKEGESADAESVITGVDITGLKDGDESNDNNVYEKVKDSFGLETVEEAEAVVKKAKGGKKIAEEDVDNTSCETLLESGKTESGTYEIDPDGDGNGFEVYCDMETDGGGWTKISLVPPEENTAVIWRDGNVFSSADIIDGHNLSLNVNDEYFYEISDTGKDVFKLDYYDENGNKLSSDDIVSLRDVVTKTVYDGVFYSRDNDTPCSVDGLGEVGQEAGCDSSNGGSHVIYPSVSNDPLEGAEKVFCDATNSDGSQGGESEMHNIEWKTISNGLFTHIGIQDKDSCDSGKINWSNTSGGSSAGIGLLNPSVIWIR